MLALNADRGSIRLCKLLYHHIGTTPAANRRDINAKKSRRSCFQALKLRVSLPLYWLTLLQATSHRVILLLPVRNLCANSPLRIIYIPHDLLNQGISLSTFSLDSCLLPMH